ncbi:hypothetical protein WJ87_26960 [Burkholderia ubonensis]|nr:hypothetical protein WJ87_26960 [Burkholderia ubonensis]
MTVGAHRLQVADWVHLVVRANVCNGNFMMDVDEAVTDRPVADFKIQIAGHADMSVVVDARLACGRISLISIHKYLNGPIRHFVGEAYHEG